MHSHLFSLHPSIWNVVENRMQLLDSDDESFYYCVASFFMQGEVQC
jgi:hypothetical protein